MSLYYDASSILSTPDKGGSLKSRVYNHAATFKSKPAHIYALIAETVKYNAFLKEVIENSGILALEPKVTPLLSLFLIHDQLFSKGGIAAPVNHPLRQSIERHKARLQAEFTKSRLRRRCATVEELKKQVQRENSSTSMRVQPRWVRINRIKSSVQTQFETTFAGFQTGKSLEEIVKSRSDNRVFHHDPHIPDLLVFSPELDVTKLPAYKNGDLILQDKASCFPAYLLLGSNVDDGNLGDIMDACAAPGNKTTHLASILCSPGDGSNQKASKIYACERDANRATTLEKMVRLAGAERVVTVLPKQDFLALDPQDIRFSRVTHLLLDPSCSGSGIIGREDIPVVALPNSSINSASKASCQKDSKKRKRSDIEEKKTVTIGHATDGEVLFEENSRADGTDPLRIERLSNLQTKIIEHAFAFPAARCITYSTCSVHFEENEMVVARVLNSAAAMNRGWRVLYRDEQPEGLKLWKRRGMEFKASECSEARPGQEVRPLNAPELEACLRCVPGTDDGTMGFFVCGFVRDVSAITQEAEQSHDGVEEEAWEGFSDSE